LKYWVATWVEYNITGDPYSGGMNVLKSYYQIPNLENILNNPTWWDIYGRLQTELKARYDTDIPDELGRLQWARASVGLNMPFTGLPLNGTAAG
jgi:hypothetical protein